MLKGIIYNRDFVVMNIYVRYNKNLWVIFIDRYWDGWIFR